MSPSLAPPVDRTPSYDSVVFQMGPAPQSTHMLMGASELFSVAV